MPYFPDYWKEREKEIKRFPKEAKRMVSIKIELLKNLNSFIALHRYITIDPDTATMVTQATIMRALLIAAPVGPPRQPIRTNRMNEVQILSVINNCLRRQGKPTVKRVRGLPRQDLIRKLREVEQL